MQVAGSVLLASVVLLGSVGISDVAVSSPLKNRTHTQLVETLSRHGMLGRFSRENGRLAGAKLRAMTAPKNTARSSDRIEMPTVSEDELPEHLKRPDRIEMPTVSEDELPEHLKRPDHERDKKLVEEELRRMMSEEFKKKLEQLKK